MYYSQRKWNYLSWKCRYLLWKGLYLGVSTLLELE